MRIGYGKFGRRISIDVDKGGFQGTAGVARTFWRLVRDHPEHTFVLIGKVRDVPAVLPPNVENPWPSMDDLKTKGPEARAFERDVIVPLFRGLDAVVAHIGENGTAQSPIPNIDSTWAQAKADPSLLTKQLIFQQSYGTYFVEGLNALGDRTDGKAPVIWLCEDPRITLKARDVKWPTGCNDMLAQYYFERSQLQDRYEDPRTPQELGFPFAAVDTKQPERWRVRHLYRHGGLEFMGLDDAWQQWGGRAYEDRQPAGIATTAYTSTGREQDYRAALVRDYLLKAYPHAEVQGKWDEGSLALVPPGTVKVPATTSFGEDLARWRSTLVLPVAGSYWSTAKTWQVFAAWTVGFHVSRVDGQGWLIPNVVQLPGTQAVGTVNKRPLYSVRTDWTQDDLFLADFLRVRSPTDYAEKADRVARSWDTYEWVTKGQLDLLRRRWATDRVELEIARKLNLKESQREAVIAQ